MAPIVRFFFKLSTFALLLALAGCQTDPVAGNFAAPKLGAVSAEAEAFRIRISCPVSGNTAGILQAGVQIGTASVHAAGGILWREIPAILENGAISADAKGLAPETDYSVKVTIGNGDEIRTSEASVRTKAGDETVEIPDPVFRRYILTRFDVNEDDVLTVPEALQIIEISVCTDSIWSLRGIEKMGRLQILDANGSDYGNGHLPEIDLSGNPMLEHCYLESNLLHAADLSVLPRLRELSLNVNPLDSIDFSHNPRLTIINLNGTNLGCLPEMTQFDLFHLHISGLARLMPEDYLCHFPHLVTVNVDDFKGARLDLSHCPDIESFWMHNTPELEELDFSAAPRLRSLYLGDNPRLRRVVVRKGTVLQNLEKDPHTEIVYAD